MKSFPFYKQLDSADCGPTCLKMIARHYGKVYTLETLRERCSITRLGVSMLGISEAAESIGFRSTGVRITPQQFLKEAPLPCIVHWRQNHFVVVHRVRKGKVYVADPAFGLVQYTVEEFVAGWTTGAEMGVALLLSPTPEFFQEEKGEGGRPLDFRFLYSYLKPYSRFFTQLILGMVGGSIILLITPFLTQALVDFGINRKAVGFVYTILIAQLMLFFGDTTINLFRNWILLHIGTRINISLISDFLLKLLRLPMSFFNSRKIGDILQRIDDHNRFEQLLTNATLTTLFSFINIVIFSIVLLIYNFTIFAVFTILSVISVMWMAFFMKKRKVLDFKKFDQLSRNRGKLIHILEGIEEIKLSSCETQMRWEWEEIQAKIFKISLQSLSLSQIQNIGSSVINQLKNILISVAAATSVIHGQITLGAMMAVTYIIGQLNSPLQQILNVILTIQDARIALERISEVHAKEDEEPTDRESIRTFPTDADIVLENVSFSYTASTHDMVLEGLDLTIPAGRVTAIVGVSGSGKTTLMKLLLKFYRPSKGRIRLGSLDFDRIHSGDWRRHCGAVLQSGYLFSDTLAKNIALGQGEPDPERLNKALEVANIADFVQTNLPMRHLTQIGEEGLTFSQGQTQRLLLARAVYKDPAYLFLDEATNSLDARNEREIMEHLETFFHNRTVVIIAHRLSTVRNADKIVVIDKGRIVEEGTHRELVEKQGHYFNLVRNQLELGQ